MKKLDDDGDDDDGDDDDDDGLWTLMHCKWWGVSQIKPVN